MSNGVQGVELVRNLDQSIAIIIRSDYRAEGIQFFTSDVFSQQLAYMNRPTGYVIPPHPRQGRLTDFGGFMAIDSV